MRAIVNVAVGRWYPAGQNRLGRSLDAQGETAVRFFFPYFPDRTHQEVPYGFKPDAFIEARNEGYTQAIWIDSSCWLVRSLDTAWAQIDRDGYLLGAEGWTVGQWCNDRALQILGRTREEANRLTLVEGKMIGLDFTTEVGNEFLDRWRYYSDIGVFNGDWSNHRHDITAAGFIAADMGLTLTPHLIQFDNDPNDNPAVYVRAAGL